MMEFENNVQDIGDRKLMYIIYNDFFKLIRRIKNRRKEKFRRNKMSEEYKRVVYRRINFRVQYIWRKVEKFNNREIRIKVTYNQVFFCFFQIGKN